MNLFVAILIGAVLGAIDGAGIFFATEEPYKLQIFLAATLKGAMVGILTGFSLTAASRWWSGLALAPCTALPSLSWFTSRRVARNRAMPLTWFRVGSSWEP